MPPQLSRELFLGLAEGQNIRTSDGALKIEITALDARGMQIEASVVKYNGEADFEEGSDLVFSQDPKDPTHWQVEEYALSLRRDGHEWSLSQGEAST